MTPLVGIIMGSKSDLDTMEPAAKVLEEFAIPYELKVVSAHRTPDTMVEYAKSAKNRGLRVIIAGAGGAAHLPGNGCFTNHLAGDRCPCADEIAERRRFAVFDPADACQESLWQPSPLGAVEMQAYLRCEFSLFRTIN